MMNFYDFLVKITEAAQNAPNMGFQEGDVQVFSKGYCIKEHEQQEVRDVLQGVNRYFFNAPESDTLAGNVLLCHGALSPGSDNYCWYRIDADHLWSLYQANGWESTCRQLYEALSTQGYPTIDSILKDIANFDKIKNRLFLRPLNLYRRRGSLEEMFYSRIEDIALALYLFVTRGTEKGQSNVLSVRVTREMANLWGVNEDILNFAMDNTKKLFPPRLLVGVRETMSKDPMLGRFMDVPFTYHAASFNDPVNFNPFRDHLSLTTTVRMNGAISVFYPGVADRLVEIFGEGFYCAFTSIHEAVIHPRSTIPPSEVKESVRHLNQVNPPEDILTNTVLYYDPKRRTFLKK